MWDTPGQEDVVICGCPNGEDFEICHEVDGIGVSIRAVDGRSWRVSWPEWRTAVFGFADRVSEFYAACAPRQPSAEDADGFDKFRVEWARRRGETLGHGSLMRSGA